MEDNKIFIDAVEDRGSGNNLDEILSGFNMYFLSYNGNREQTRLQVPMSIRKTGLWITYVLYDKTVISEWYSEEAIDDDSWKDLSNWENCSLLVRKENKSIVEDVVTIQPNVFNKWGEMLALDITLGPEVSNALNEYMIEFISGETPTVFKLQGSVKWSDGILDPESNMTYQVSIVNGLAVYAGWPNI